MCINSLDFSVNYIYICIYFKFYTLQILNITKIVPNNFCHTVVVMFSAAKLLSPTTSRTNLNTTSNTHSHRHLIQQNQGQTKTNPVTPSSPPFVPFPPNLPKTLAATQSPAAAAAAPGGQAEWSVRRPA
jgi:hypothetical protein